MKNSLRSPLNPETKAARPGPPAEGVIRDFTRGTEHPRGVVWFGARSFWGHLRHFIASAIATENNRFARLDDSRRSKRVGSANRRSAGRETQGDKLDGSNRARSLRGFRRGHR